MSVIDPAPADLPLRRCFSKDLGDRVIEDRNGVTDEVRGYLSVSIVDQYVENLTLSGSDAIDTTGNGQENVITGNAAANVIDAGKGNYRIQSCGSPGPVHR